jgi:hypothetical protein
LHRITNLCKFTKQSQTLKTQTHDNFKQHNQQQNERNNVNSYRFGNFRSYRDSRYFIRHAARRNRLLI